MTGSQRTNDARLKDVDAAIKKLLDANEWVTLRTSPDVAAAPGLQVELDGKAVPKTELNAEVIRPSTAGGHTVKVTAIGRGDASTPGVASRASFTVVMGPTIDAAPPPGRWGWQKWSGVGLVGAGVVAAAVGVVGSVKYRSDVAALQSKADITCKDKACAGPAGEPAADQLRRRAQDLDSDAIRDGLITYGLAGALVVGGAVLFFTAPSSSSSAARLQVVPRVGAQESGLSVAGTF